MEFAELYNRYDFTESDVLRMEWRLPTDYVLHLNYYWNNLYTEEEISQTTVAVQDQPIKLILETCTYIKTRFFLSKATIDSSETSQAPYFGVIFGWGEITSSELIQELELSPNEWIHIFFDFGLPHTVEAVCKSLRIEID